MSTLIRPAVRAARVAATGVAVVLIAACSSGSGSSGAGRSARPAAGSTSPTPAASASTPNPRASAYVLPASAAPTGFTPTAAEPETPAEKKADQDTNRCLGLPADEHHIDEADGPDLDDQQAGASVSTTADVYTAAQVATDVRYYGNPTHLATIIRCYQQVGGTLFATPDEHGTTATIQSIQPLDISYLSHHVLGLRLTVLVTATSGVASTSGGPGGVVPAALTATGGTPAAATAATRTVPLYIDDLALASGRIEQQIEFSQALQPPDATLERGLAVRGNALLDHQ